MVCCDAVQTPTVEFFDISVVVCGFLLFGFRCWSMSLAAAAARPAATANFLLRFKSASIISTRCSSSLCVSLCSPADCVRAAGRRGDCVGSDRRGEPAAAEYDARPGPPTLPAPVARAPANGPAPPLGDRRSKYRRCQTINRHNVAGKIYIKKHSDSEEYYYYYYYY